MSKCKPVLFKSHEVINTLAGRQTQFRRALKEQPIIRYPNDHAVEIEWLGVLTRKFGGRGFSSQELLNNFWEDICNQRLTNEVLCPYGKVGDRLWVRETFADLSDYDSGFYTEDQGYVTAGIIYRADDADGAWGNDPDFKWKPSIHMPRSASRITLENTGVRVERLQDISEEDAIAEGFNSKAEFIQSVIAMYKLPPDANPWVWVVEFKSIH